MGWGGRDGSLKSEMKFDLTSDARKTILILSFPALVGWAKKKKSGCEICFCPSKHRLGAIFIF